MTHTPAPWHVDCAGIGNVWSKDCKIADTNNPPQDYMYRDVPDDERRANSCLISAAPDLLEACLAYVEAYDAGTGTVHVNKQMRAAIAKARGE